MEVAVASQNRKEVTGHAGRCRRFWIYEVEHGRVVDSRLVELPKEETFHETPFDAPHPLDHVDAVISGGMGRRLYHRLRDMGIDPVITDETDPDRAAVGYLDNTLTRREPGEGDEPD